MVNTIIKLHKYVFKIVFHTIKDFLAKMLLCKKSFYKNFKMLSFIPINFYKIIKNLTVFVRNLKAPNLWGLILVKTRCFTCQINHNIFSLSIMIQYHFMSFSADTRVFISTKRGTCRNLIVAVYPNSSGFHTSCRS